MSWWKSSVGTVKDGLDIIFKSSEALYLSSMKFSIGTVVYYFAIFESLPVKMHYLLNAKQTAVILMKDDKTQHDAAVSNTSSSTSDSEAWRTS